MRWVVALVLVSLTSGACVLLAHSQADGREELEARFAARGLLAADFTSAFVAQLTERERVVAAATLGGEDPQVPFDAAVAAFGFQAALLLDADGRALAISPGAPALLGTRIGVQRPHLRSALAGVPAVSSVVSSAITDELVVAFAVPFQTPGGRRVLSGAFVTGETPLRAYLDGLSSLKGYRALIVDDSGRIVSASGGASAGATLSQEAPALAAALTDRPEGTVQVGSGRDFFDTHMVAGTPWRLLTVVPLDVLLQPVSGAARVLPWVILAALVVAAGVAFWLALRLVDGRRRLQAANARLDDLANVDGLTGVANRRQTASVLDVELARAAVAEGHVGVLLLDVDHFKRVNDTFGHAFGDTVLREVAARLSVALREGDLLGRWGGEEFLVVLPGAERSEARAVAERLREVISSRPFAVGTGDEIDVTVSVGVASTTRGDREAVVHQADRALYAAKGAGRNLVIAAAC